MKLKRLFVILFLIFLFFSALIKVEAQPVTQDAPPPCPNPPCDIPPRAPITETIIILLAGGIGLGIKSISKKRKNQ